MATVNFIGPVTGISGTVYDSALINFNAGNYLFIYGKIGPGGDIIDEKDITQDLTRADKLRLVPDFNVETENYRIASNVTHDYKPGGIQPLEENTAAILADQLISDPLAAPLDALSNGFDKVIANGGVRKLALLGFLGLAIYFVLKTSD